MLFISRHFSVIPTSTICRLFALLTLYIDHVKADVCYLAIMHNYNCIEAIAVLYHLTRFEFEI